MNHDSRDIQRIVVDETETDPKLTLEFTDDENLTITADTLRQVFGALVPWVLWFGDLDGYAISQEITRGDPT